MNKINITPSKIIISHVYSKDNKGDAALLSVLINDTRKQFKNSSITILTMDSINKNEEFEGITVQNSFMFYVMKSFKSRYSILLYSLYIMNITLLWAHVYKLTGLSLPIHRKLKNLCQMYSKTDLVLPVGGGYLRSHKKGIGSLLNILLLVHPIWLSRILRKPTILYTQSIGPFSNKLEERIVSRTLSKCVKATIVREDTSMQLLKSIGVNKNAYRSVDSGFAFNAQGIIYHLRKRLGIEKNQLLVGITARKWLPHTAQCEYERALSETVKHIVTKHNAAVVFIPQVTAEFHEDDDRVIHKRICQNLKGVKNVYILEDKVDHYQIKAAYDSLDLLIGTRFHSVIFSLTSYVPAIAIEYEHKTGGIMHDLGLDKWVVKIEEVNSKILCKKVDELIVERKAYKSHLKKIIPDYVELTNNAIKIVQKYYKKFVKN